jgi:photoactive yellow protein
MRPVKFGENNLANELARMSDTDLDSPAFGAIELDGDGKIIRYNAAEADISSREQAGMVGRNFFLMLRPAPAAKPLKGAFALPSKRVGWTFNSPTCSTTKCCRPRCACACACTRPKAKTPIGC